MPVQTPQWTDLLCCCICYNLFDGNRCQPISLVCGHTACRSCLLKLKTKQCPFDQSAINIPVADLPQNMRIMRILGVRQAQPDDSRISKLFEEADCKYYNAAVDILDALSGYLQRAQSEKGASVWSSKMSRPMQRKLVTLLCCQLVEPEGRNRALKAARSLGERSLMELLLLHQNPYHLSSNLWAAVRARGCQFLGPAMQEEVLKLVLLALSEGALISRKVLVMYIVQTLEKDYPQASKTSVGHVVQLLYRASCFNVFKRDGESSLMQLKEEFRMYDALRREHDTQIVQIAIEAGLRISPDQWSALLYGDQAHKSHMQSIIDQLQTPQSFGQSIQELLIGLQRTGDPGNLVDLRPNYELLADIDPVQGENFVPTWISLIDALTAVKAVVDGQVRFCEKYGNNRNHRDNVERNVVAYKYKTSMCRDIGETKLCPRGESCTFAHSVQEMERYRARSRLLGYRSNNSKSKRRPTNGGTGNESDDGHSGDESFFDDDVTGHSGGVRTSMLRNEASPTPNSHVAAPIRTPSAAVFPSAIPGFQAIPDDGVAASLLVNTPPPPLGNGTPAVVMQWPPGTAILNTPNGPIAVGGTTGPTAIATNAVPPLSLAPVRYQVFRHGNAPATAVPVAAAPVEYGFYYYPTAPNTQSRGGVYPDVLHLEVPLARVVQNPPNVGIAAVNAGTLPNAQAFADVPTVPTPTTTLNNYVPFAQADSGTVYFYPSAAAPTAQHVPMQLPATVPSVPFGVLVGPTMEEMMIYSPPTAATQCVPYPASDVGNEQRRFSQPSVCSSLSATVGGHSVYSTSSSKTAFSCVTVSSASSGCFLQQLQNKDETEKQGRLQQLTSKKKEILQRLRNIKSDKTVKSSPMLDCQSQKFHNTINIESSSGFSIEELNSSTASTILTDEQPNYAAAVVRGKSSATAGYNGCSDNLWTSSATAPLNNTGVVLATSATSSSNYSPWKTSTPCNVTSSHGWSQTSGSATNKLSGGRGSTLTASNTAPCSLTYNYATRPYIPDEYIDIKHLSDDLLRKELEQLPPQSKRSHYVRLELEARDADTWRSDDDQVIPFSNSGPQVSRYGPISRTGRMQISGALISSSINSAPSDVVMQVKDILQQPLPTASLQPTKEQPVVSRDDVDPSQFVSAIPQVFKPTTTSDPATIDEKIERLVEVKQKLSSIPLEDGASSSAEKEQLKFELELINKEMSLFDKRTEETYLLKALENVNLNIEELEQA